MLSSKSAWHPKFQIKLRYRNQFCYLNASKDGKESFPIGRLRYFDIDSLSLAFYAYSSGTYKPCLFRDGSRYGTVEAAITICSGYLQ
jgi:hypothetical protein